MLTVYFDTAFFIDLASTTDEEASFAIDRLNQKGVRVVFSRSIAFEMLRNVSRPERDRRLVERLAGLRVPFYLTDPNLHPVVLLSTGQTREIVAATLKAADARMTEAFAANILATTDDEHPLRAGAEQKMMDDLGIGDPSVPDDERARIGIGLAVDRLREALAVAEGLGISASAIATRIADPAVRASLQRQGAVMASVAGRTDQPYRLVLGTISEKSRTKLAHTIRDARHMVEYCDHSDAIDLLQVDQPRYSQIENDNEHAMRILGFGDRCFARADLRAAVEFVSDAVDACA